MIAVEAHSLGKQYRRYHAERPWSLHEFLTGGFLRYRIVERMWSLRDVSFTVQQGHALGVVGRNGAGKSTLLRLLSRVLLPDEGTVIVRGRIGGLLELTAGFHPDLTGRENVIIGGVLRGLTRSAVREAFDSIVSFAELEDAIDRPLRTYSSGMQMRLAFSVVVHSNPEVLLVDEVLAVGDLAFQQKCLERIRQLRRNGCSIVLVSHDPVLVETMCDRAIWLNKGEIVEAGSAPAVVQKYAATEHSAHAGVQAAGAEPATALGFVLRRGKNRFGEGEVDISNVKVRTGSDPQGLWLVPGDCLSVCFTVSLDGDVCRPAFSVTVVHDDGTVCLSVKTGQDAAIATDAAGTITARWDEVRLEPGVYYLDIGAYDENWTFAYDYHSRCYPLIIRSDAAREPD